MKINQNCKLFLRDVYSYDVEACHYNILKNIGYDVSKLDYENKLHRNIQIGKMMKNNPQITKLLRSTTESILDEYINVSGLKEDDIITRQYDGLITTKPLKKLYRKIPLKLKYVMDMMIISINRDSFIGKKNNNIIVKGISNKYPNIEKIYKQICNINFLNKRQIFTSLENIKDYILYNSDDCELFFIPNKKDDNYGTIFFKEYGQLQVNRHSLNIIDPEDIDREFYFNFYVRQFTESLTIEFI